MPGVMPWREYKGKLQLPGATVCLGMGGQLGTQPGKGPWSVL